MSKEKPKNLVASVNNRLPLTEDFYADPGKKTQWQAFLKRNKLETGADLEQTAIVLRDFLMPPTIAEAAGQAFDMLWPATGPWTPRPAATTN